MKITDIKPQVKTPGRFSIYIDGSFAFGLSESGLLNTGLRIGSVITDDELMQLKSEARIDKALNQTLNLIARRPRSVWEIDQYLRRKSYSDEEILSIQNALREKDYLDDADFARRWVESRRLLKPISRRKLQVELRQKRVSDEDIKSALDSDETDEVEVLRVEVAKKRRQTRYQDDAKLMAYLARQGYGYDDIRNALKKED
jgi:regulatory protein